MKIDFITASLNAGGAERVLVLLANYFSENSYCVRIITFNEPDDYSFSPSIIRVKLHHGNISNHKIRSLSNLISFYRPKNNRPEVMISFITQTSFIAIIVAKLYGLKIIASEHNSFLRSQSPKLLTSFTRTFLYPLANYLTVLTNFDVDFYQKKGINVVVMPNPCSFNSFNEQNSTREKFILAVGNLDRYYHKGFDNLLKLIVPVLKNHRDWTLKIVGDGKEGMNFLKQLTNKLNIVDQVVFTGFRKDVNILMQESEIFILSSRYEGLPMVLLEAMSQGMACIAYDCKTGPSDIIKHGINGLLIEDQNMEAMQRGVERLINEQDLRERLKFAANKTVDNYSIDKIAQKWEKIFLEMNLSV